MIYFARYYRVFRAIQVSAKQEWSGENIRKKRPQSLGEKPSERRRWDPPYTTAVQFADPSTHPTENP